MLELRASGWALHPSRWGARQGSRRPVQAWHHCPGAAASPDQRGDRGSAGAQPGLGGTGGDGRLLAGYPLVVGERLIGVWAMLARHPISDEVFDAMGAMANAIAVGLDRKRAAEAMARSEGWLATTLASIGDAVIATDGDGQIRFMNPVAERLTGWSQGEATGRPMEEVFRIINEQTRLPVEHPVARVIREARSSGWPTATVLIAKDGRGDPDRGQCRARFETVMGRSLGS